MIRGAFKVRLIEKYTLLRGLHLFSAPVGPPLLSTLIVICALLSTTALSQTKAIMRLNRVVDFGGPQKDTIETEKLSGENRLSLVGKRSVKVLDLVTGEFLNTHQIEVPDGSEDAARVISPDGRRMLVFGNYNSRDKKDKVKRPAAVWDLQTGKRIAILDRPLKPVRAGHWSRNGKTLATSSASHTPYVLGDTSVEISFWDGETFQFKNSLPSDKVNWWYLTADGEKCFFTTAGTTNLLFIVKFISEVGGPIRVWNTNAGTIEQSVPSTDQNSTIGTRAITVSPNEKFIAYVAEQPKGKEDNRRLVVLSVEPNLGSLKTKYEIAPAPKLPVYGVSFSPDDSYFAFDAGKTLQIYDTSTGEKWFELRKDDPPRFWLDDNRILLYYFRSRMQAAEAATGRELYEHKLVYRSSEHIPTETVGDSTYFGTPQINVYDQTTVLRHPKGRLLLTQSNQYVQVYDGKTGQLLQTLVSPPMDYTKKKPSLSEKSLVWKAGWAADGNVVYVIDYERQTVSIWQVL